MPKFRAIVRYPDGSDAREQRSMLAISSPSTARAVATRGQGSNFLGNALAGRRTSGGGRIRGGSHAGSVGQ